MVTEVEHRFVALGLGRFVRVDRVIALEPLEGERRGPGRRTLVWVDGLADPIVASRSEHAILADLAGEGDTRPLVARGQAQRPAADAPPSLF